MKRSSKPIAQQFNLSLLIAAYRSDFTRQTKGTEHAYHGVADRRRLPKLKKKKTRKRR